MYKYIFFDLDGTLTQSEFGIMAAAVRALNHFGIETPSKEILKKFIGPPLYVSFHDFYGLVMWRASGTQVTMVGVSSPTLCRVG